MELLAGWNRVRRNLVGTFFLQAKSENLEIEFPQPEEILVECQTYSLPFTQVEREYRELAKLDDLLEKTREEYEDKQKEFALRWRLCSEKNDLLKQFVTNFETYYEVSKLKQKADLERNQKREKDLEETVHEANRLEKELARMKELKVELEKRRERAEFYRKFMNSVVEQSKGEFEDISQVIARYQDLKAIRDKYVRKTVEQIDKAFLLQNELKEILKRMQMEGVSCEAYLSHMDDYKHRLQVSNWRKQDNLNALKIGLKHELLKTHIPEKEIYNLYLLLCQEMEQPIEFQERQLGKQLEFIQRFLKELAKVSQRTKDFFECPSDVPLVSEKSVKRTEKKKQRK